LGLPAQYRLVEGRPALVYGNTAVLRPAELPISRGRLVERAGRGGGSWSESSTLSSAMAPSSGNGWSSIWASRRSVLALVRSGPVDASASTESVFAKIASTTALGRLLPLAGEDRVSARARTAVRCVIHRMSAAVPREPGASSMMGPASDAAEPVFRRGVRLAADVSRCPGAGRCDCGRGRQMGVVYAPVIPPSTVNAVAAM
jgi:hypothetical protein